MSSRMNREEFFGKLAGLDTEDLKKALWTLYWRGAAPLRARIEEIIEPERRQVREQAANRPREARAVLDEVTDFAALARSSAYLGGDRRVSPKERSRWRFTFRGLVQDAQSALRGQGVEDAVAALGTLIDLACETRGYEYFRSDDPMEAARFVVSDAVAAIWARLRDEYGASELAKRAPAQLVRWESRYGWTRRGYGWVAERETSLANTLARFLDNPDLWTTATRCYLDALDRVGSGVRGPRSARPKDKRRADDLSEWHLLLVARLIGSEQEELLDRIVAHPALAGPELTFVQAVIARERGDLDAAAVHIRACLASLPGHPGFRRFADEVDGLRR